MAGIRFKRAARNRWRKIAIWAMLPLAVLNSRTVLGCGCSGHFESACHCTCSDSQTSGRSHTFVRCGEGSSSACPCCTKVEKAAAVECGHSEDGTSLAGSPCKAIAAHKVIPATVVSVVNVDKLTASSHDSATIDLPIICGQPSKGDARLTLTAHPPNDLVVTLHRLVI